MNEGEEKTLQYLDLFILYLQIQEIKNGDLIWHYYSMIKQL